MPLQCKLFSVIQADKKNDRGMVAASAHDANGYDRERMVSLINPVSEELTGSKQGRANKDRDDGRPPERHD